MPWKQHRTSTVWNIWPTLRNILRKNVVNWRDVSPQRCWTLLRNGWKVPTSRFRPRSRLGQAISYAYPLWPRMKTYLNDGCIKIDNNLAENAIRPLTLSRKNFLFCGNHEAAENTAIICSLLATCKAQEINPREWLNDVIAQLPHYLAKSSGKNVRDLLPDVWKLKKSNENPIEV